MIVPKMASRNGVKCLNVTNLKSLKNKTQNMLTLKYPIRDKKGIYVIGDSHSVFFYGMDNYDDYSPSSFPWKPDSNLISSFKVYHIGPALAYNLCKMNTTVRGRETILYLLDNKIDAGSRVLLAFGEIDCRYYIFKASRKYNLSIEQTMENCIKRYISVAKEIKARGHDVMIWGAVASRSDVADVADLTLQRSNAVYVGGIRVPLDETFQWATCAERNILTRQFNDRLEELLADESIRFASIFEQLVDYANETKDELYLSDNVHLSQKMMPAAINVIEHTYSGKRETSKV